LSKPHQAFILMPTMEDCIFCKVIKGELPSKKEYEDKDVIAFRDINPVAPVHVLIVPKKHITNLVSASDKDGEILGKCQLVAKEVAKKVGISDAFRVLTANSEKAGQSVFHLHYHLIGGWNDKSPRMESEPGGLRK